MRAALLLVARVIARTAATIVLLIAYGRGMAGRIAGSTVVLLVLTLVTWAMFRFALARGIVHEGLSPRKVRPFRALVAATALSVPVAFVFGMLEDAQLDAQQGCLRSIAAPLLVSALLGWHEYARRRLTAHPTEIERIPKRDDRDLALHAVSAGPPR